MKLLHLADLHLDSPFQGISQRLKKLQPILVDAPYQAFSNAVNFAIEEQIDVVVIAGDIYDSNEQTILAQYTLIQECERLKRANIAVVMIHGNHDYLSGEQYQLTYPDNVLHLKESDVTGKDLTLTDGTTIRFYGFSYHQQWIEENKISEYPENPNETDYTIGLLHGDQKRTDANNYAPFTIQELIDKNYDYWALGHVHQSQILNDYPRISYSGTIQGRHHLEKGEKGGYLIEFESKNSMKQTFVSFAAIRFEDIEIECTEEMQASEIIQEIDDILKAYELKQNENQQSYLLTIYLKNSHVLPLKLQEQIDHGELMQALPIKHRQQLFIAINKVKMVPEEERITFEYNQELNDTFNQLREKIGENDLYQEIMAPVFKHSIMRQYLSDFEEDQELHQDVLALTEQTLNKYFDMAFEVTEDED